MNYNEDFFSHFNWFVSTQLPPPPQNCLAKIVKNSSTYTRVYAVLFFYCYYYIIYLISACFYWLVKLLKLVKSHCTKVKFCFRQISVLAVYYTAKSVKNEYQRMKKKRYIQISVQMSIKSILCSFSQDRLRLLSNINYFLIHSRFIYLFICYFLWNIIAGIRDKKLRNRITFSIFL